MLEKMNVAKLQRRYKKLKKAIKKAQADFSFCSFKLQSLKKLKLLHKEEIARRQRSEANTSQGVAAE